MLALIIFGLRLLRLAVYAEAAVILVLLVAAVLLYAEAGRLYDGCELARAERDQARYTLGAIRHMSDIRHDTVRRMARADERSRP
jgi:hypothetical protein